MPELYIVGGPNGAGKTTTAFSLFPQLGVTQFVNADLIARGMSPLNPESQARQAGRIMLNRLEELVARKENFAFETTLASRSFAPFLERCRSQSYRVTLLYMWLKSSDLALERVAARVRAGGHNIPSDIIRRRYERGRKNFVSLYAPLADDWGAYDNSGEQRELIATGGIDLPTSVYNQFTWQQILS